ncbi:hypothetical protein GCM10027034_32880 [Ramlibacter solisilvae]
MAFIGLPWPTKITGMRAGLPPAAANADLVARRDKADSIEAREAVPMKRRRAGRNDPVMAWSIGWIG